MNYERDVHYQYRIMHCGCALRLCSVHCGCRACVCALLLSRLRPSSASPTAPLRTRKKHPSKWSKNNLHSHRQLLCHRQLLRTSAIIHDMMWRLAFALVACVARVDRFAMARRPHQQVQAMTMQGSHRIGLRKSMQESLQSSYYEL